MSASPAAAAAGGGGGAHSFSSLSVVEESVTSESGVDDFEFVRYLGGDPDGRSPDGAVLLACNTRPGHPFKEKMASEARGCEAVAQAARGAGLGSNSSSCSYTSEG